MLKINFEAETGNDRITALTVAHAVIERAIDEPGPSFEDKVDFVEEVADHLSSFVRSQRNGIWREERIAELERYKANGEVRPNE